MKKTIKQLFKIAISIVLGIIIIYGALLFLFWWNIRPISNVSAFERVMNKRWHNPDLIKHFPSTIPILAEETKFFYRPGFLQGGSTIELRIKMPREFVDNEINKFKSNAKLILKGDQELNRYAENPNMVPKWKFHTFPEEDIHSLNSLALLPGDFEIYLLSSRPYKKNPVSWNHGECSGISISIKRNEIIYWAEDW